MLLKNKIVELQKNRNWTKGIIKYKKSFKIKYNKILLLQARGFSLRDITNITGLKRNTVKKYLLYYEYHHKKGEKVSLNSKQEPYYKNEMQYASIPTYNYEELSKEEKDFYIDNLKLNN